MNYSIGSAGVISPWKGVARTEASLGFSNSCLRGKALLTSFVHARRCQSLIGLQIMAMASKKKVNVYDDGWKKQWFGAGIFAENTEDESVNIVKKLEKKKLLSQVEKSGLLSRAESAGLSLSTIEKLGLLSKAEQFGLLSLAERLAYTSPAALASFSLPLFVGAIAAIVLIPDDSSTLVVLQGVVAGLLLAGAGGLFILAILLGSLQEE